MRPPKPIVLAIFAALVAPGSAAAAVTHTVTRGESLTSVAAADGLSIAQLAAANHLSPSTELTAGSQLVIPPRGAPAGEPASRAPEATSAPAAAEPATGGGYLVAPGDTLSSIAARYGVSVPALAAANGMRISGVLEAGRRLSISGAPVAAGSAASAAPAVESGAQPTGQTVSAAEIGAIAAQEGVSPSLAEAIGYQESGFNNAEVSRTGAIGVMQIEPGTWRDLEQLGGPTLSPDSATDNIRGGVELLGSLLAQTGGDPAQAAAAYYQGLRSVREHGMFADTRNYVANVLALQARFGG